jgi:hypothetical protein
MKRHVIAAAAAGLFAAGGAWAQSVEVLHWWTSGGEAAALGVLKKDLEKQGVAWKDMPVAGGGGEAAMTSLRARVTAKNPPTAVQMLGFDIQDWAKQGALGDLNALAAKEGWDKTVPAALQAFSKHQGKWIAAPVNVHSTNWVWASRDVLSKAGVSAAPANWDDFIAALDKVQKAGFVALAHGGQAWQEATIFDGVVLATGGVDFYNKALVNKDKAALGSDTMKRVFDRMAQLRKYVDKDFSNRDWNLASAGLPVLPRAGHAGHGVVQLRPVRDVQRRRGRQGRAGQAGLGHHEPVVPERLQRRQGLRAGAHRCARRGLRRLRQEGHEGPGRGQQQGHAGGLDGPRPLCAGIGEERLLRRHHPALQRQDGQRRGHQGHGDGRRVIAPLAH